MTVEEKKYLIDLLSESQTITLAALQGIDPETLIYAQSDWTIRDIVGHLATWDRQVTKSIRAYREGSEYAIPDLGEGEVDFNQQAVMKQRKLTVQQVLADWDLARADFKAAVEEIPLELFPGDLLYPWGDERGDIAKLVRYMVEHDTEHRDEIVKAIGESQKG
jgi:hypothetical protein